MICTGRLARILAPTAVLALASVAAQAQGNQSPLTGGDVPVIQTAAATFGEVRGRVTDAEGVPLDGAMVSALGTARVAFAVCDAEGRFDLRSLPAGAYLLRVHLEGFATSRHWVDVKPNTQMVDSFILRRGVEAAATADASVPSLVEAGFVSSANQPDLEGVESIDEPTENSPSPHDHSERAWRIRHLKRSILKEVIGGVETLHAGRTEDSPVLPGTVSVLGRAVESSARLARMLLLVDDLQVSGQVSLLTSSTLDPSADLGSDDARSRGVAYLAIGAPAGDGHWSVRSAIANGEVSSWVLAGAYTGDAQNTHALDIGMSLGGQRDDRGGLVAGDTLDAERWTASSVHAFDSWSLSPKLAVDYGAQYARYGHVERTALFSPRMGLTVSPIDRTRVRALISQRMVAPGVEEILLPPTNGLWRPPERRFASLSPDGSLRAERARHVEFVVEHELTDTYVVGVRRFYQGVNNQLITLFGVDTLNGLPLDRDHYYLASAGSVNTDGWGVSLNRSLPGRVRGWVDYSLTRARWSRAREPAPVGRLFPSALRPETEAFHDVTTSVETEIPETSTRVFVLWRVNTAYAMSGIGAEAPGLDARFDIHVRQALPFAPLDGSTWELLVAVRSLFRDPWAEASTYDELLVVRPPKRVIGGLVVRF